MNHKQSWILSPNTDRASVRWAYEFLERIREAVSRTASHIQFFMGTCRVGRFSFAICSEIGNNCFIKICDSTPEDGEPMKLFKRTGKANKKWRDAARLIDIHKTKVTIVISDRPRQAPAEHLPPWIYKKLLDDFGLSDAVDMLDDPEWLGQKDHLDQVHAKLTQQLGL